MPDRHYYDTANSDILRLIPADASLVIDVGCGSGALGAAYKKLNPDCRYVGIEYKSDWAREAAERIDEVIEADAATLGQEVPFVHPGSADCLIYGDLLEHLVDPWATLVAQGTWVRSGGCVLASIPNVQHVSVLLSLLAGVWEYEDLGILDRTHLRFFTLRSSIELFAQAGLRVVDVFRRELQKKWSTEMYEDLVRLAEKLGLGRAQCEFQLGAYQYVLRAEKP